jgi:hypothetical protein
MSADIFQRIDNAQKLDFGKVISDSINLFKKVWVEGLIHLLISIVVMIPFIILFYLPFLLVLGFQNKFNDIVSSSPEFDVAFIGFIIITAICYIILICVMQALMIGVLAHFYKVCKKTDLGLDIDTGGYFEYFKTKYFKKLFVLALSTIGIAIGATLLCYFPIFYVIVPLHLIVVIFAFNENLSVKEIIQASFKLGNKFWFVIFGLIFISGFMAQLGMFLCLIGIFFTAFFARIPAYFIYKDTIGFNEVLPLYDSPVLD